MMYGEKFAYIYNRRWVEFINFVAPKIMDFFENNSGYNNHKILDLCCGTGQFASFAAEKGYCVTGVDISKSMLKYAKKNNLDYIKQKKTKFILGDASRFKIDRKFSLIVSTYDAVNHFVDEHAVLSCFKNAFLMSEKKGFFLFDINTEKGLSNWNNISVRENSDELIITSGFYDKCNKIAQCKIRGFWKMRNNMYSRFEEIFYNKSYTVNQIEGLLDKAGWKSFYTAKLSDLSSKLIKPEDEFRVFFVACNR